jgi:hypothetical protein
MKLLVALVAPVGVALYGLASDSHGLFVGGSVFTGLVLGAALLGKISRRSRASGNRTVIVNGRRRELPPWF